MTKKTRGDTLGPFNATTGAAYTRGNVARLLSVEASRGYEHRDGWAGFGQWAQAGRMVRKGEKGTRGLTVIEGSDGRKSCRAFTVFHLAQTDPMTPEEIAARKAGDKGTRPGTKAHERVYAARRSRGATIATSDPAPVVIAETRHVDALAPVATTPAEAPSAREAAALAALGIK